MHNDTASMTAETLYMRKNEWKTNPKTLWSTP